MLYHGRVMNHVKYFGIKGGEKHYEKQKAYFDDNGSGNGWRPCGLRIVRFGSSDDGSSDDSGCNRSRYHGSSYGSREGNDSCGHRGSRS